MFSLDNAKQNAAARGRVFGPSPFSTPEEDQEGLEVQPEEEDDDDLTVMGVVGDVGKGFARGMEGFARSSYNLLDTLSFDLLPDVDDEARFFSRTDTVVGGLVEGATQFLAGFATPMGAGHWVGKIPAIAKLANAGAWGKAASGAIRGAAADFQSFDGHEQRVSNFVQQAGIETPFTDWLAADDEDSELEGRLKNAIEGVGLGAMVDGIMLGFRKFKGAAKLRAKGAPEDQVLKALDADDADVLNMHQMDLTPDVEGLRTPIDEFLMVAEEVKRADKEARDQILRSSQEGSVRERIDDLLDLSLDDEGFDLVADRYKPTEEVSREIAERVKANIESGGVDQKGKVNFNLLGTETDPGGPLSVRAQMDEVSNILAKDSDFLPDVTDFKYGEQSHATYMRDAASELAQVQGMTEEEVLAVWATTQPSTRKIAAQVHVNRMYNQQNYLAIAESPVWKKIQNEGWDAVTRDERAEFQRMLGRAQVFTQALMSQQDAIGNALRSLKNGPRIMEILDPDIKIKQTRLGEFFSNAKPEEAKKMLDDLEMIFDADVGEEGMPKFYKYLRMVEKSRTASAWSVGATVFTGSILSGPQSAVAAFGGALGASFWRPLEGVIGAAASGDAQMMRQMGDEITGLFTYVSEAWRASRVAWKTGRPTLGRGTRFDPGTNPAEFAAELANLFRRRGDIAIEELADEVIEPAPWMHKTAKVVGFAGRGLQSVDTFVQELNFRSRIRSEALKEARTMGLDHAGTARHISNMMDRTILDGAALTEDSLTNYTIKRAIEQGKTAEEAVVLAEKVVKEWANTADMQLADSALDIASVATATKSLQDQEGLFAKVGQGMLAMKEKVPALHFIAPFVTTPMNIAQWSFDRTLGSVIGAAEATVQAARKGGVNATALESAHYRLTKEILSENPRVAAEARGRVLVAGGTLATLAAYADTGIITGRGPDSKSERDALMATGWRPYSIRVGDKYVSYRRMDPVAGSLGMIADFVEVSNIGNGIADDSDLMQIGAAIVTSLSGNVTNKTFLTGIQDFMEVVSSPSSKGERYLARLFGGAIVPSAVSQLVPETDAAGREVYGLLDIVKSRIPGVSDSLAPMRNMLGEVQERDQSWGIGYISPIKYASVSSDTITNELARLRYGIQPPSTNYKGVNLLNDVVGNQTAYDRYLQLHGEVKLNGRTLRDSLSRMIRSRAYQSLPEDVTDDLSNPRVEMIRREFGRYRREARRVLMKERGNLSFAVKEQVRRQSQARMGRLNSLR